MPAAVAPSDDVIPAGPPAPTFVEEIEDRSIDSRLLAVSAAGFCVFLSVYATQALLPLLAKLFRATEGKASMTVTAVTVGVAIAAPAAGLIAERIGRKTTIVGAIFLLAIPTYLASTANTLSGLIAWRFVQGLVMPGIIAVTMAYVAEEWPPHRVGSAMAAYVTGNVLAGVTGRFMSGWVGAHYGWPTAFIVLAAMDVLGGLVVLRFLPPSSVANVRQSIGVSLRQMAGHLRNPRLLATYFVGANILLVLVAAFTYITFHLADKPFNLGPAQLGSLFLVYLVGVVVTPIGGVYIDRTGQKFALLTSLAAITAGICLTLIPSIVAAIVGLAILSSGIFICQSSAASYMGLVAGKSRASASGLYATFYYLGGAAGAFVPGLFWTFGGWPLTVGFILTVIAITAIIAGVVWVPRERLISA